jgi:hypothetical protein
MLCVLPGCLQRSPQQRQLDQIELIHEAGLESPYHHRTDGQAKDQRNTPENCRVDEVSGDESIR